MDEMKRLGFWDDESIDFKKVEQFFETENKLSTELYKQLKEKNKIKDPEKFIAEKHKQRKLASKQKQKETKEKREQLRLEKAKKWQESKEKDIIFLGAEYSKSLGNKQSDAGRLRIQELPVLHTAEELAKAMNISRLSV